MSDKGKLHGAYLKLQNNRRKNHKHKMEVDLEFILFAETKEVKTKQNIDLK